ncbi:TIGR03086 family metal-binding protein [Nocardia yamanashiensis]|uniref:TIGR03086 family metal-binding protein n=1 Tax=Nocardia yamanashiensis TaxID=209247 RepID=UPI000B0B3B98|nr:TIGR03086 family metal-binding protein [Nocardia yamanashiensis]
MQHPTFDMEPAAIALETVVTGITDEQLELPTPTGANVRALLAHVAMLTEAFRQAATKESVGVSVAPTAVETVLGNDWRTVIPAQLKALVAAWQEPAAWVGETEAGGVLLPAAEMAGVALDEMVIHGWDLARATSQPYAPDSDDIAILLDMMKGNPIEGTPGLFGPVVAVPDNASSLDRLLGLTGRDPDWTASHN